MAANHRRKAVRRRFRRRSKGCGIVWPFGHRIIRMGDVSPPSAKRPRSCAVGLSSESINWHLLTGNMMVKSWTGIPAQVTNCEQMVLQSANMVWYDLRTHVLIQNCINHHQPHTYLHKDQTKLTFRNYYDKIWLKLMSIWIFQVEF